tara:strand:- start:93848 stop:94066 length:219 start_codon:yes stop_codon:yes gene_type:complete
MKLSNQALGALMMALQKSLMEQSDIVPVLQNMDFVYDPEDPSHSTLVVTNPPVVNFEGVVLPETTDALTDEE